MTELGTTTLISGGTRGIGLAAAAALLDHGHRLVLLGRSPHPGAGDTGAHHGPGDATAAGAAEVRARLRALLGQTGDGHRAPDGADPVSADPVSAELVSAELVSEGRVRVEWADVADPRAVAALAERLVATGVRVDVLINSAGLMSQRSAKTLRTTPAHWREVMGVNLDGAFHLIAAFVPGMVERRSGRIISLSACLGRFTGPGTSGGLAPYRVAKAALNALTKNLAAETGEGTRGILVDAVCPGHCRTDMGGPDAPRSAAEGAQTVVWLATRDPGSREHPVLTGRLWEDGRVLDW